MRHTDSVITNAAQAEVLNPTASSNTKSTQDKKFYNRRKFKQLSTLALAGIAVLAIPAKSDNVTKGSDTNSSITVNSVIPEHQQSIDRIIDSKILTVAAVKGDSTFFSIDGFEHGFGYDLARSYANKLNVNIKLKTFDNPKAALASVAAGQADMALTTVSTQTISKFSLASVNLSCGRDAKLTNNGLHPKVSWTFANADDSLAQSASHYVCDNIRLHQTKKLASFYNQNLLRDAYNKMHFEKALTEKLPLYQYSFKTYAKKFNHDWELLVAMGYQESHLRANAISRTGVQGIMMLTRNTAESLGIRNRIDPKQSIRGGARYLEKMKTHFKDVPKTDRTWFALASYNMGPYAIKDIQSKLREQGKNDKSWENVYAYMSDNADSNSRFTQCMHYVTNIRSYLESIKFQTQDQTEQV